MRNYKIVFVLSFFCFLQGCSDEANHFFHGMEMNDQANKIEYSHIHQMNLNMTNMSKSIDESGFSPSLQASFSLKNTQPSPWPQAWVAFLVNISIKDKPLASLTKSGSLHEHSLNVNVEQLLPKYGINKDDIHIEVKPISWMPTYPLNIQSASNTQ